MRRTAKDKRRVLRDVTESSIESPMDDMRLDKPAAIKKAKTEARNAAVAAVVAKPVAPKVAPPPPPRAPSPVYAEAPSPVAASPEHGEPSSPVKKGPAKPSFQFESDGFARPAPPMTKRQQRVAEEIERLQQEQARLIMQVPFTRTVRDISCSFSGLTKSGDPKLMWHIDALDALHEAAETYLVEMFEDANTCAQHAGRMTVDCSDLRLAVKLRGQAGK